MKSRILSLVSLALGATAALLASPAGASITWTSSTTSVPAYAATLNFDEAPIPGGVPGPVASNAYLSRGVSALTGGGAVWVGPVNSIYGTGPGTSNIPAGNGNQAARDSYLIVRFTENLTALSVQFWESAPNFNPVNGGGARIDCYNNNTLIDSFFINNPRWGTDTTASWFNLVASAGTTFNHIEFNGFSSTLSDHAVIDNLSWTVYVPPPCSSADVGVQGGTAGHDHLLDNNDFVSFIALFFANDPLADLGVQGGTAGHDSLWDNNDFVVFIGDFFNDQAACSG